MRPEILFPLFAPIGTLKGVGAKVAPLVERLAGPIVRDLLFVPPHNLIVRERTTVAQARDGEVQTFEVTIDQHQKPRKIGVPYKVRAFDGTGFLHLTWFRTYGDTVERALPIGTQRVVSGKVERFGAEVQLAHPDYMLPPERADEIPPVEPVYPATAGLSSRQFRRLVQMALEKAPELPEWQDGAWLDRNDWPSWREALATLHGPESERDLSLDAPARKRLAYDELLAHQLAMIRRKLERGHVAAPVLRAGERSAAVEAALPFRLTGAQQRAMTDIRADIGSGHRMSRLLQGDVGSGKTVVAVLAMADAASSGFQAALMAPTEILARQHFERIEPLLASAGLTGLLLTGRDKGAGRKAKLAALAEGSAQVAVGTHALFQDEVTFKALALAVVDEQHRFGVNERRRLQEKGAGVHLLSMSATPIPRTLELTQYGDLDVSRLDEKPPGRKPITTAAVPTARIDEIAARLDTAVKAGAQAYWICPLVAESEVADLAAAEARAATLRARLAAPVGLVHGQMPGPEKDAVMTAFAAGELSILVATTVVEVGVDVPNATIMVIEHAERFGLAQLHQLRGRVGRGSGESSCILLYDAPLSETAKARLDVLRQSEDGFQIAEEDWRLRGGGDLLGLKQSGFPDYRMADPIAHRDLLLAAADDARLVLGRDPELKSERGRRLRVLSELFDWRADRSNAPA
ncbi:ATP-dependent DNA helicase RecG [Caulobacter sp. 17J80-11]|uniref:ATP-dependent DNA helicase RecG n=1 Tax=Caulobacter sp. 17J80-11 TaxID=2763502 RepID=UPI001653B3CE|nr:ATP-dependent DNA helicase RecG [Caulobacter sp. 17J80-11]MBC6980875.1 ATP-dependent DNA helicase RecG [Caulobacter sp. 17J80-11]